MTEQSSPKSDSQEFEAALRTQVDTLREGWQRMPIDPLPLAEAHRLLDDAEIKQGWIDDLVELTRSAPRGVSIFRDFPPRYDGEPVFTPFAEVVQRQLRPGVLLRTWRAGRFDAKGIEAGNKLCGEPVSISGRDRFLMLDPNFEDSTVSVGGKVVLRQVTVSLAEAELPEPLPSETEGERLSYSGELILVVIEPLFPDRILPRWFVGNRRYEMIKNDLLEKGHSKTVIPGNRTIGRQIDLMCKMGLFKKQP